MGLISILDLLALKTRWLFFVTGILAIWTEYNIGWFLLIVSITGFINNSSTNKKNYLLINKKKYSLPAGFEYSAEVKKNDFIKCPVCKKGKIKQDNEKPKLRSCNICNAEFKKTSDLSFKLSIKHCGDEYKNYQYVNCDFSLNEWNTIAMTGKTLRENTLEKLMNGDIPNLSNQEIESHLVLKSKEHFIFGEQSRLHEPRHQEIRSIDNGYLTLTNKRLVFSGGRRSSNVDLRKIINISVFTDGFKINIENRQKPQFFTTNDSEFWNALLKGTMKHIN